MADKQIPEVLADLPEDWGYEQIVAPDGVSVGLTPQHGYNYLMKKVNECARVLNQIAVEMGQVVPEDMVTADGGGELLLPVILGGGPYEIEFTEEETAEYALKSDLSKYAPKDSPVFSGSISMGRYGAVGPGSAALGSSCAASGRCAAAFGEATAAKGIASFAAGLGAVAEGWYSVAMGHNTVAKAIYQVVFGDSNVESEDIDDYFIVGNGMVSDETTHSNCFRVSRTGVYGGEYHSTGADYAEIYEWVDGNPDAEDRMGRFVVLDGENIRLASSEDDIRDILGIVSGNPSIVGDSHDDQWRDMYLRDVFGRLVYEDVEVEDPEHPGRTIPERRRKLNPDYNPAQTYIPQSKRPEKSAVGLLGKLVMIDDGTCEVNGWCAAGPGGIAVKSGDRTRFRVMSRLDNTHIRVNIMMQ